MEELSLKELQELRERGLVPRASKELVDSFDEIKNFIYLLKDYASRMTDAMQRINGNAAYLYRELENRLDPLIVAGNDMDLNRPYSQESLLQYRNLLRNVINNDFHELYQALGYRGGLTENAERNFRQLDYLNDDFQRFVEKENQQNEELFRGLSRVDDEDVILRPEHGTKQNKIVNTQKMEQKEQQPIIPEEIKKEQKSQVPEVQKEKAEKTQQSKDVLQKPMDVMAREDVRQNSNMERDFDNKFNLADTAFASYSKTAQDFLTGFKYAAYQGNPNNWQDVLSKWNLPVNAPDNLIEHKYHEMLAELDSAASNMGDGEAGYFFEKLTGDYMRLRGKPGFKWVAPAKGWRESTYNRYMYGKQQEQQTIKPEEIKKEQKTQMPEIQKKEPPLSQKLEMMWALDDVLENQNSKDSNSFDKMWNGLREASDKGLLSEEMKQEYRNVIKWAKEEHASKSDAVEKLAEVLTAQRDKLADKDPFLQFAQSERDALFPKKKTEKTQQNKDVLQKPADLMAPEDVKKDEKRQAVADFKSGTQKVLDLDKQIEQDKQKKLNQAALAAHRRKILLNRGNGNV